VQRSMAGPHAISTPMACAMSAQAIGGMDWTSN